MAAKDILVVFKKNFEEVHDESLLRVKAELDQLASCLLYTSPSPRD